MSGSLAATAELETRACFQHHGEVPHCLLLRTQGSPNVEKIRRSTNLPLNKTSTKTEGQGEGISGEERGREIVHHQCFLEQPLSDMPSETK